MNSEKSKKYKYYEIRVTIRDTHPPVWRRLQIPQGTTFHELSAIIQLAFGWCGYHAYDFELGATLHERGFFIELPELENGLTWREVRSSKEEVVDKYFEEFKTMKYTYDFGDNWLHDITVEKIVETDIKLSNPICTKAKMADLPEDCGGPWGYEALLDTLSDPKNKDYKDMREWVEGACIWYDDRNFVDIEEINIRLEDYKEHAKSLLGD